MFIKLHTHGLIERHASALVGDPMKRFLDGLLTRYGRDDRYRVHFATAREAANIALAATDGRSEDPGRLRDYRFVRASELSEHPLRASGSPRHETAQPRKESS